MSRWEKAKLENVCNFIDYRGKTPAKSNIGLPFITAKNVKKNIFSFEPREYITEETYDTIMVRGYPETGNIIFTTEAPLGNVCRIPYIEGKFAVGQRIIVMQPHSRVLSSEYLDYALKSSSFQDVMWRHSSGSTVKGIRSAELVKLEIPLPPLKNQNRFAKTLDIVTKLLAMRKQQLAELDNLIKSIFYHMFGDLVTNEKGWGSEIIDEVAPVQQSERKTKRENVWLLNLDSVESKSGRIIKYKYVPRDSIGNSTIIFDETNVLYSKLRPYLNKVVLPHKFGYGTSELLPLKPVLNILNREYLTYFLRSNEFVSFISERVAGAKMPRVVVKEFKEYHIPIPPLSLQTQFAEIVTKIEEQKALVKRTIDETQYLFYSLMSEYFE